MTMPSCPKFILLLPVLYLLTGQIHCEGEEEKIKLEVTHVPSVCTQKSKRGDLVNAHYDGYLAKDLSKFYCRLKKDLKMEIWLLLKNRPKKSCMCWKVRTAPRNSRRHHKAMTKTGKMSPRNPWTLIRVSRG
ncbi:peptidyl-prolyl cis-trans isomerase FKBP7-like [Dendrobates tinctorius]|uniref:peptidyl-prolyl cis-trans isomerase FKBP7-like n=1 Tax=Dendrobates tinctorius TaxID=92724 RepID=UPI003CC9F7D0